MCTLDLYIWLYLPWRPCFLLFLCAVYGHFVLVFFLLLLAFNISTEQIDFRAIDCHQHDRFSSIFHYDYFDKSAEYFEQNPRVICNEIDLLCRVEPARGWFSNTKVISQDALQKFQEEMGNVQKVGSKNNHTISLFKQLIGPFSVLITYTLITAVPTFED